MNTLSMERSDDGVVVIHIDDVREKINAITADMTADLEEALQSLQGDRSVEGVIFISDKEDTFVAGADIKEFDRVSDPETAREFIRKAHGLFDRIENLPVPVVAAIRGACLGGGLELALACRYRIAADHPKTVLGLPEAKLGIIPAAGGTQRLPRLIGIRKALPLMLRGATVDARQAKAMGLVDVAAYPHDLLETARKCLSYWRSPEGRRAKRRSPPLVDQLIHELPPARSVYFRMARRESQRQTRGVYPAIPRLIKCAETGLAQGLEAGLQEEARAFSDLVTTQESKALRSLFFATTALKKNPLAKKAGKVKDVAVLGAGLMGSGIAAVTAAGGIPATLKDRSRADLARGLKSAWAHFDHHSRRRREPPPMRDRAFSLITPTLDYDRFSRADVVIEAVFEDLTVKRQALLEVEEHVSPECLFATNTSAIPIGRIASEAKHPERVIGMHYFSPVPRMPLLEVVVGPKTDERATALAAALGRRQGKTVIVVQDGPGFYTSRILCALLYEAVALLRESADIRQVDEAVRQAGFPVGPFKLLDEIGIDVAAHVSEEMAELFTSRGFSPPTDLSLLVKDGFHGRKNGRGFYNYARGWRERLPSLPGLERARAVNGAVYARMGGPKRKSMELGDIQERLLTIMVNEAALCLQEGILSTPRDGDAGAVLGLGFPPFTGGPFRYLDTLGIGEALIQLERLTDKLGPRFQPAPLLVDMAVAGDVFYKNE